MRLHWLLPTVKGIPVLMYHRVLPGVSDGLTVTPEQLREQWDYLRSEGYECLSLTKFLRIAKGEEAAPAKAFVLTFDDGYANNLTHACPLLKEFGWSATIFLIGDTLDGSAKETVSEESRKLTLQELQSLDPQVIQLAMHGYHHENFSRLSPPEAKEAIAAMLQAFEQSGLPYHKVLAYPYGARPKNPGDLFILKALLDDANIEAAFRIGNKPERIPSTDIYELKRIDIRGEDSPEDFKIKLRKGKIKPF